MEINLYSQNITYANDFLFPTDMLSNIILKTTDEQNIAPS